MTNESKIIEITKEFIEKNTFIDQTILLSDLFDKRYLENNTKNYRDNEVKRWILISEKIAEILIKKGEMVLQYNQNDWWALFLKNELLCLNDALQEIACELNV